MYIIVDNLASELNSKQLSKIKSTLFIRKYFQYILLTLKSKYFFKIFLFAIIKISFCFKIK